MKVTFKWDGKDAYTPKFKTFVFDDGHTIFFGLPTFQDNETEMGVLWMADDLLHNFESFSLDDDAFIFKTIENVFIFRTKFAKTLPKAEINTGIIYIDDNDKCVKRNYNQITFENI